MVRAALRPRALRARYRDGAELARESRVVRLGSGELFVWGTSASPAAKQTVAELSYAVRELDGVRTPLAAELAAAANAVDQHLWRLPFGKRPTRVPHAQAWSPAQGGPKKGGGTRRRRRRRVHVEGGLRRRRDERQAGGGRRQGGARAGRGGEDRGSAGARAPRCVSHVSGWSAGRSVGTMTSRDGACA